MMTWWWNASVFSNHILHASIQLWLLLGVLSARYKCEEKTNDKQKLNTSNFRIEQIFRLMRWWDTNKTKPNYFVSSFLWAWESIWIIERGDIINAQTIENGDFRTRRGVLKMCITLRQCSNFSPKIHFEVKNQFLTNLNFRAKKWQIFGTLWIAFF